MNTSNVTQYVFILKTLGVKCSLLFNYIVKELYLPSTDIDAFKSSCREMYEIVLGAHCLCSDKHPRATSNTSLKIKTNNSDNDNYTIGNFMKKF